MPPTSWDAAGHPRSEVTQPAYHVGRPPHSKGRRYPADPPTVEEIVAVMRGAGTGRDGARLRALIVVLWRAGLRVSEALALTESDMDARRGATLVRHGKGNKRREVGMDIWAWEQLRPWQQLRTEFPVGAFFCVIRGPTAGRPWEPSSVRRQLQRTAAAAGVRRRFAPHQLRHAHAVEMARKGVPLVVIQRQLGHANLGVTSIYLQGIDNSEIIDTVHARRPPVIPAAAGLRTTLPAPGSSTTTADLPPRRRTKRAPVQKQPSPVTTSSPRSSPTHMHG
jgi:site-specific recombinase XerD